MKHHSCRNTVPWTTCWSVALALLTVFTLAPAASPQAIVVKLVALTSSVSPGKDATITVSTSANAKCEITVLYKSGPSKAQGLFPKPADSQGRASWTWRVGSNTTPGSWPITVTCSAGGQKGTLETSLVVSERLRSTR